MEARIYPDKFRASNGMRHSSIKYRCGHIFTDIIDPKEWAGHECTQIEGIGEVFIDRSCDCEKCREKSN